MKKAEPEYPQAEVVTRNPRPDKIKSFKAATVHLIDEVATSIGGWTTAKCDSENVSLLSEFFSACFNRDIPPLSSAENDLHTLQYNLCPQQLLLYN